MCTSLIRKVFLLLEAASLIISTQYIALHRPKYPPPTPYLQANNSHSNNHPIASHIAYTGGNYASTRTRILIPWYRSSTGDSTTEQVVAWEA